MAALPFSACSGAAMPPGGSFSSSSSSASIFESMRLMKKLATLAMCDRSLPAGRASRPLM